MYYFVPSHPFVRADPGHLPSHAPRITSPQMVFFWFFLEAEIIQQTQPAHPLPSPYTEHAGARRCGGMRPRGPPEAPLEPRRKVGPLGPIKTFCQKKKHLGGCGLGRIRCASTVHDCTDVRLAVAGVHREFEAVAEPAFEVQLVPDAPADDVRSQLPSDSGSDHYQSWKHQLLAPGEGSRTANYPRP